MLEFFIIAGNGLSWPAQFIAFGGGLCLFCFWAFWGITRQENANDWHATSYIKAKRLTLIWVILLVTLCPLPLIRDAIVKSRKDLMLLRYTNTEKVEELEGIAKQAILGAIEELTSNDEK